MSHDTSQPDSFHENAAAYAAGGLSAGERSQIEQLAETDPTCHAELEELMALDLSLHRAAGVESIVAGLEDRVTAALDARRRWAIHPIVRRAALATAACVALGAFGYLGSQQMEGNGLWGWTSRIDRFATLQHQVNGLLQIDREDSLDDTQITSGVAPRSHRADTNSQFYRTFPSQSDPRSANDSVLKLESAGRKEVADTKEALRRAEGSETHSQDGQNVLAADGHAEFNQTPLVGTYNDSIYTEIKESGPGAVSNVGVSVLKNNLSISSFQPSSLEKSDAKDEKAVLRTGSGTFNGTATVTGGVLVAAGGDVDRKLQLDAASDETKKNADDGVISSVRPSTQPAVAAESRRIIRTGELEFEVDRFDSAAAVIGKIVNDEKGFVATTSSDKLANGKVRGAVVVRIPPDHLDVFVLQLRSLGDLKSQRIGSQDIGKEYTDLESELRADRAMEERLLDLIKNGKGEIKDLLAAEKELAEWRGKIEKIVGQMKFYDNQVALSTLTITLTERNIATAAATVEQETITAGVEADDVEKARSAALSLLADAKARIVSADLKKLDAGQMAATIVADIPNDGSGPVIDRIKQLGKVARLEANKSTTTDPNNPATPATRVEKRDARLTLSLYNVANVAPRQSSTVNLAATDVEAAYAAIMAKVAKAGGRVVSGGSTQSHPDASRAGAQVELPADLADGFLLDLRGLGDVISVASTQNADTSNVTTSKRGFAISIFPAAALPARESGTFRIETGDVEQASATLQASLLQSGGHVIDSSTHAEPGGVSTATLSVELPLAQSMNALAAVRASGKVLGVNTSQNAGAPTGPLAKCRVDITFTTPGPITGDAGGLMANLRNGFALSAKGLLYSAQLVVIGLCFVLPWALAIWVGMKFWRRRKVVATSAA